MAHQSWINYMNEPSKGSIGSVSYPSSAIDVPLLILQGGRMLHRRRSGWCADAEFYRRLSGPHPLHAANYFWLRRVSRNHGLELGWLGM
ncbi:hypothetical protein HZ326_20070 [Fusarium oxysporum f. sp. albedinis]|nr:hypothetical protein HZ326_20070 [Fusarium oxysporum f. sp. albedinis]